MAIKGFKDKELDKRIREIVDRETDAYVQRLITAGNKQMKQSYINGMEKWYGEAHMLGRTFNKIAKHVHSYETKLRGYNQDKVTIVFHGYVDEGGLESEGLFPSARKWKERHEEEWMYMVPNAYHGSKNLDGIKRAPLDMEYSPSEYVFNLQWEQGIAGLPKKETKTGTGWINSAFKSNAWSMEDTVSRTIKWDFSKLNTNKKLAERHQTQGAGISSSNRIGMSNLPKNRSKSDRKAK